MLWQMSETCDDGFAVSSVEMGHERGEVPMLVVDKDRRMSRNGRRIETSEGIVDI